MPFNTVTTPLPVGGALGAIGAGVPFVAEKCDKAFVPRQRLLLMTVCDKEVTVAALLRK